MRHLTRFLRFVVILTTAVATVAGGLALIGPRAIDLATAHEGEAEQLELPPLFERSYVFDRAGNRIATLANEQNRDKVPIEKMSDELLMTVLASEDADYYQHEGVDVRSILRAFSVNIDQGGVSQGGSTITQQVVGSVVGKEQTLVRKLREATLAVHLEDRLSKERILERYLNTVYLGNGVYGVEAAAQYYFNVAASELDWAQSALLAALIPGPSLYDPFDNRERARERRSFVYDRLIEEDHLTPAQVDLLELVRLPAVPNPPRPPDNYFVEQVKQQLLDDERLGETAEARQNAVFGGGLRIHTTLDQAAQLRALAARNETLPNNQGDGTFSLPPDPVTGEPRFGTAAMASIQPATGAVRMLVGGPGFDRAPYDLAVRGTRQPGSSFKPFVLATLMEQGYSPQDVVDGSGPCEIPGYPEDDRPDNYGGNSGAIRSLRSQTLRSSNCAYLRLGQVAGLDNVADLADRMGITTPLEPAYSSMPIGAQEVHPFDMAAAYSVFANDGVRNPPYFIEKVTDAQGRVLFEHDPAPKRVISTETARLVTDVLIDNVRRGTGTRARLSTGQVAAGKTGTTNSSTDVWFVGYTPRLSTVVWMGAPEDLVPLSFGGGATGGRYPARTWGAYMQDESAANVSVPFVGPDPRPGSECLTMPGQSSCSGRSYEPDGEDP